VASRLIATYLNDHLAGSVVGVELARRAAGANRGTSYEATLEQLAREIAEDRETLEELMRGLGVGIDRAKVVLAWGAEKLGRAKLNGRLLRYSPLSRLEELEALSLGIEGKLLLWRSLSALQAANEFPVQLDLDALIKRAKSQRRRLERCRLKAAGEALTAAV
jgi:hypothetical protein